MLRVAGVFPADGPLALGGTYAAGARSVIDRATAAVALWGQRPLPPMARKRAVRSGEWLFGLSSARPP